jgi:hypothetical protein
MMNPSNSILNMHEKIDSFTRSGNYKEAASLIKELLYNRQDLIGKQILYAHILLLATDWHEISSLLPKDTNHLLSSGWLLSVANGVPINNEGKAIPWYTYPSIDFLDSIKKNNWNVFEWGSGYSTLWWAQRVDNVYSIEDNESWHNVVKNSIPKNMNLVFETDSKKYIEKIKDFDEKSFDAIVIDGSHRNECAFLCIDFLKDSGIIIFDNSDCIGYQKGLEFLKKNGFKRLDFWGLAPSYLYKSCTSIFSRDISFLDNIDSPPYHESSVGMSCCQAIEKMKIQQKNNSK